MARTYAVQSGAIALASTAAKSLVLINPAVDFLVAELGVSFDATAAQAAIAVDLYRTTTLGTPAGTAATLVKENQQPGSAGANTTNSLVNLTTEPTAVEIIRSWYVQPFGGLLIVQFPLGREPQMSGSSTQRIGLRVTPGSTSAVNVRGYLDIEE